MGSDQWIVNNRAGEQWGLITRLILDTVTRQISYADVVVIQTGLVTRIPWNGFEIRDQGIMLDIPEAQAVAGSTMGSDSRVAGVVAMEVWP